ncbi:MAG: large conductance mechanosensitive channel protein MscL [Bifidobacteriaceae bacterium]|jgi:large conductance mechanosensitive channel|nr:large conductance mechanosensitive channel protein MscL [Bifidobacteriaceae bacterium]
MKGFRDFLMRGNLIDLAVAFILGASFGTVVSSFTQIIMDLIGLAGGNPNFDTVTIGSINVGKFLTALVAFVIVAAVLYFAIVRPYQMLKARLAKPDAPAKPTTDELLTEIRDLLASNATNNGHKPPMP